MSVGRRKSQVFVEIPFSPLHRREVLQQSSRSYIPSPVANVLSNKRANVQQQQQSKLDTFFSPSQNLKKRKLDNEMEDENKPFHGGAVKRSKVVDKEKGGQSGVVVIDLTVENAPIENKEKAIIKRPRKLVEPIWQEIFDFESREEVEERIHLREFVIRFAPVMRLAKMHVEALDEFDTLTEQTTKAVLKGILDLIAADEVGRKKEGLNKVIKQLSACNSAPKIWDLLSTLRDSPCSIALPDPALPASESFIRTRTSRSNNAITRPIQLVPVLVALTNIALMGPSIRAELELGIKELPAETRKYNALIREEMERWSDERKSLGEEKAKLGDSGNALKAWKAKFALQQKAHKIIHRDLILTQSQALQSLRPRYFPLGTDSDGRVYYALSRPPTNHKVPTPHEREVFQRWTWFVFVWGKKPAAEREEGKSSNKKKAENEEEDSDDEEKWWGFYKASEIRKLVKWLEKKAGSKEADGEKKDASGGNSSASDDGMDEDEGEVPSMSHLRRLVKGLSEFADFLDSRVGEEVKEKKEKEEKVSKEKEKMPKEKAKVGKEKTVISSEKEKKGKAGSIATKKSSAVRP